MALSNKEKIGRVMDAMLPELAKYVEQELRAVYADGWKLHLATGEGNLDIQRLCNTMLAEWEPVFLNGLGKELKSTIHDVRQWRNHFAHQKPFTLDDTLSALIASQKIMEAIDSPIAEQIEKIKIGVMRSLFDDKSKKEQTKMGQEALNLEVPGLRPWREIVVPHKDVAEGDFQQAEFAADLWQVYQKGGTPEYQDAKAFFGRTFVTDGLKELLLNAMKRLRGEGGDPVIELKINFGGGKTHSMLALYHLFGGQYQATELSGIEDILATVGTKEAPTVKRAVLVGVPMRPGAPIKHDDGVVTNTLWGELAWQLGGREGYEIVRATDENATNPGDLLDKLFALVGPSLILIDEWVAYARQLFEREKMLPAGSFDTQFTFAQALCEAARRAKNVLVCISIPASERDGQVYKAQVGDVAGRAALERLQDAVGRSNMVWRPATSDESFEIVRRRLFEPIESDKIAARDATIKKFIEFYRANRNEFPPECCESGYERRMLAAYPIHPELFDRLYGDWSTLEKFQRTRGVLRFMAKVIHSLWDSNAGGALILPASVPLADAEVQSEIAYYLPENWSAVLDKDVDGFGSIPKQLDAEFTSSYGKYSACRRVARTVFMGSAPLKDASNRGINESRVKLGSIQPFESIPTFGDALNKLRQKSAYLYGDANRYWYHTQASVNREAQDRANRITSEQVHAEIKRRLVECFKGTRRGEFGGVHVDVPSADIHDDRELRLVVLSTEHQHKSGRQDTAAIKKAQEYLEFRGSAPRMNQNRLIFLAADSGRFAELEGVVKQSLAWASILEDVKDGALDLDNSNERSARDAVEKAYRDVMVKLGEVVCHVLVPYQAKSNAERTWESIAVKGGIEQAAVQIVKKLEADQLLTRKLGGNVLKLEVEDVPLWRGNHVSVAQLLEDYSRYTYLHRLIDDEALYAAVREGVNKLNPEDGFAYADSFNDESKSYEKLRTQALIEVFQKPSGLLVKPDVAQQILDELVATTPVEEGGTNPIKPGTGIDNQGFANFWGTGNEGGSTTKTSVGKNRFFGRITLGQADFREKAGDVSREVAAQLAKVLGSKVEIVVEIRASSDSGFSDDVLRTVSENCRTLKFESFEFEED